jgi:hypothetical protein
LYLWGATIRNFSEDNPGSIVGDPMKGYQCIVCVGSGSCLDPNDLMHPSTKEKTQFSCSYSDLSLHDVDWSYPVGVKNSRQFGNWYIRKPEDGRQRVVMFILERSTYALCYHVIVFGLR